MSERLEASIEVEANLCVNMTRWWSACRNLNSQTCLKLESGLGMIEVWGGGGGGFTSSEFEAFTQKVPRKCTYVY